jgi:signal transduction histidine kinase
MPVTGSWPIARAIETEVEARRLVLFGVGEVADERLLGLSRSAADALAAKPLRIAEFESVRLEVERALRADALVTVLLGPRIRDDELVRSARVLTAGQSAAAVFAVRSGLDPDSVALAVSAGCCDVLAVEGLRLDDLCRALRLGFEVSRRRRAEAPWMGAAENDARWPPPRLIEARRLAGLGRELVGTAHDLRNLLQPMSGFADLARRSLPVGHRAAEACDQVVRSCERAERLLRRTLASVSEGGPRVEEVEGDALVAACEAQLRTICGEAIALRLRPGAAGVRIRLREGALDRILLNFAANARDAMPAGGRIEIRTRSEDGLWIAEVEDSGRGVDPKLIGWIFEPGSSGRTAAAGHGLGLWIVRGLVSDAGGEVALRSVDGSGTVAIVRLPVVGRAPTAVSPVE